METQKSQHSLTQEAKQQAQPTKGGTSTEAAQAVQGTSLKNSNEPAKTGAANADAPQNVVSQAGLKSERGSQPARMETQKSQQSLG